jgi:hypothetical protein
MSRLVKGAETSMVATSDMYSKSNTTGDLANSSTNRAGGMMMGRMREDNAYTSNRTASYMNDMDEEDFTTMAASSLESPSISELSTQFAGSPSSTVTPQSVVSGKGFSTPADSSSTHPHTTQQSQVITSYIF